MKFLWAVHEKLFPRKQFRIQSQVFDLLRMVTKKKLWIAVFFAPIPFLTDLCNKILKISIHCFQLWRKTAQLVRASKLSKKSNRYIDGMLVFCNPCARATLNASQLPRKTSRRQPVNNRLKNSVYRSSFIFLQKITKLIRTAPRWSLFLFSLCSIDIFWLCYEFIC